MIRVPAQEKGGCDFLKSFKNSQLYIGTSGQIVSQGLAIHFFKLPIFFFLFEQNPADIDTIIREKKDEYTKANLTVQPYLVFIRAGNQFEAYYGIIDNNKYKLKTAVEAVDFLFKLFFAIDIKYPPFCEQIWRFIQIAGFDVREEGQKLSLQLKLLLSECKI